MLPKPEACRDCPLWGDGRGYVPDEIVPGSSVMAMGQNPGKDEEEQGKPFVGKTGESMNKVYLPLAGLERGKVSVGNVIRCRWQGSNDLPKLGSKDKVAERAIAHCRDAHFRPPESVKVFVSQGAYALYSLTGETKVSQWRGWALPYRGFQGVERYQVWTPRQGDRVVLATIHLADLFRDPEMLLPTRMDWGKVQRILAGRWPEPLPEIHQAPPAVWPKLCAFDTEFNPETGQLLRYSMATPDRQVYVVEAASTGTDMQVPEGVTVILHNAPADIVHLRSILGSPNITVVDTMLMHSVLWSGKSADREAEAGKKTQTGSSHRLEFLGSKYARINRWKHLAASNETEYSAGDAVGTWDSFVGLMREMDNDPQSWTVYKEEVLPLIPIIMRATATGIRVEQGRVAQVVKYLAARLASAEAQAQAAVGWPINLASPAQVAQQLYDIEGIQVKPRGRGRK